MQLRFRVLGLLAWALAMTPSCGGPSFDGRVYRSSEIAFRVGPVPRTWRSIEVEGAALAFRDDPSGATVAVNGRCGVDGDDVPLAALTHHLFLNFTQRKILKQEELQIDGRGALRTELGAHLDGVPKTFVVYVLKKDGCVYDFMWIGAESAPRASVEQFEAFVTGFSTNI
ncbi:MAG: hypothetical protein ACOY0T_32655 [Myxococcota bacterium]